MAADQDEDREAVRAQDMREHESLQQAGDQRRAGGGRAQQEERDRDHPVLHVQAAFCWPSVRQ